jgi:hypothetical protein
MTKLMFHPTGRTPVTVDADALAYTASAFAAAVRCDCAELPSEVTPSDGDYEVLIEGASAACHMLDGAAVYVFDAERDVWVAGRLVDA